METVLANCPQSGGYRQSLRVGSEAVMEAMVKTVRNLKFGWEPRWGAHRTITSLGRKSGAHSRRALCTFASALGTVPHANISVPLVLVAVPSWFMSVFPLRSPRILHVRPMLPMWSDDSVRFLFSPHLHAFRARTQSQGIF